MSRSRVQSRGRGSNVAAGESDLGFEVTEWKRLIWKKYKGKKNRFYARYSTRVTEGARRERHEKGKTGCRPRFSRLAASPLNARARALPLLNLKKKRDCSQSTLSSLLLSTASSNRPKLLNYLPTFLQVWRKLLTCECYMFCYRIICVTSLILPYLTFIFLKPLHLFSKGISALVYIPFA